MATSTRLRGKSGLIFTLKVGAGAATSYADDIKSWAVESDDADDSDLTFYEAQQGLTKVYTLKVTAIVSADEGALWAYLWDNPGAVFDVVLGPWGNAVPSTTKPHFTFVANATGKPPIENEARVTPEGAEFEYEFDVVGDLTKVTAA